MNRVLLVEDHATFRQALATIFESETDLEAGAQADSGIPVLVLTESRDRERHARALGAYQVLTKDISVDEIVAEARRLGN